jgi:hypothetical protein
MAGHGGSAQGWGVAGLGGAPFIIGRERRHPAPTGNGAPGDPFALLVIDPMKPGSSAILALVASSPRRLVASAVWAIPGSAD